jgi:hypothetical protein
MRYSRRDLRRGTKPLPVLKKSSVSPSIFATSIPYPNTMQGLLSSITTVKSPADLKNNLNNDFYLFINFYLKLEIMSI